jgi:sterol desaturase/sphingolipid hydroxylase (fatty acid hydroxylase superfamily)
MESLIRHPAFIALVLVFIVGEWLWRTRIAKRGYDVASAWASIGVAAGNFAFKPLNAVIVGGALVAAYQWAPVKWSLDDWRVWAIGFVLVEFAYYWFHRFSHEVRWMWASHAVHHSATEMTFPAAIRLGWTGALSGGFLTFVPLALAGFHPLLIGGLLGANLAYQFFLHTEAFGKWGPLEWLLNTPAHHRVHHASNAPYLDKNYGGVLIVFDRLFGTFAEVRADEPIRYGLTKPLESSNPFVIALDEWRRLFADLARAPGLRAKLATALGRPGDGPVAAQSENPARHSATQPETEAQIT